MNIKIILTKAFEREITNEEALFLLSEINTPASYMQIFQVAEAVTRKNKGNQIQLISKFPLNFSCTNDPHCEYCGSTCAYKKQVSMAEFEQGLSWLVQRQVNCLELAETTRDEDGEDVLQYAQFVHKHNISYWINVGNNLSYAGMKRLKELGMQGIGSSFEVIGERMFVRYRPGDHLTQRWKHAEYAKDLDLHFYNYLMVGAGETNFEIVEHFSKLKAMEVGLHYILVPWSSVQLLEVLKVGTICRLMNWQCDLDIGGRNNLELNIFSGGNSLVLSGFCVKKELTRKPECVESHEVDQGFLNLYDYLQKVQNFVSIFNLNIRY